VKRKINKMIDLKMIMIIITNMDNPKDGIKIYNKRKACKISVKTYKKNIAKDNETYKRGINEIKKEKIGERNTAQREKILQEIRKMKTHPTAMEVYLEVRKKIPNISLGTVYRNLEIMSKKGLIRKLTGQYSSRYDGMVENHFHFICKKCNKIYDIPDKNNEDINKITKEQIIKMKEKTKDKHEINECELIFYGFCNRCK
jgi:Fe2+ or Zn2+ uptake regulation protein